MSKSFLFLEPIQVKDWGRENQTTACQVVGEGPGAIEQKFLLILMLFTQTCMLLFYLN